MSKEARVQELIRKWTIYRGRIIEPNRYLTLKDDLYNVRNAIPGTIIYPNDLIDTDDEIMAAVEHYFLCRAYVGNGQYSSIQLRVMKGIYNLGKEIGITPRHNPSRPVTPPSELQTSFQDKGITDGEFDLKKSGGKSPIIAAPPKYY